MLSRRRGGGTRALIVASLLAAPALAYAEEEEDVPAAEAPASVIPATAEPADGTTATEAGAPKKKRKKKKKKLGPGHTRTARRGQHDGTSLPWQVGATAGMLDGAGTLVARAATTGITAALTPTWVRGRLELSAPIRIADREAIGADLSARDARVGVEATYRRSSQLRAEGTFDVRGAWRPGWPDQYQPLAGGALAATDRFGHLDLVGGAALTAIPVKHWHARVAAELASLDYVTDPAYSMARPTHIVPRDRTEVAAKASARYFGDGWKAGVGLDAGYTAYAAKYARDAGTGLTHAGAGGPPPNPLYRQAAFEPRVDADVDLVDRDDVEVELDLSYGHEIVNDVFQGYYTYRGHHPEAKLRWRTGALEVAAKADVRWRTYGPDSYAEGAAHPPLAYGDRRVDRRLRVGLDARFQLTSHWAVRGEADAIVRRTNFPSYVPGVYPATQAYDIDWSYENYVVEAGVEYRP